MHVIKYKDSLQHSGQGDLLTPGKLLYTEIPKRFINYDNHEDSFSIYLNINK